MDAGPPHAWHQRMVAHGHAAGRDGVINDHFLVCAASFRPRGSMPDAGLAGKNIDGFPVVAAGETERP